MPDLALYHNGLSSCSQKVRLVLAEKGLDFTSHDVNLVAGEQHAPDYVKLNPNHVVPTLVHEGRVLTESSLIDEYLEDAFPQPPLLPADPAGRHAARLVVKQIDEKVHPAAGVLTYAIGARNATLSQPEEVREANINSIPDAARRALRRPSSRVRWGTSSTCWTAWRRSSPRTAGSPGRRSASPTWPRCPTCCGSSTSR